MKVGFIVDGEAEFRSLPGIIPRLGSPHTILHGALLVPINGCSPIGHIAASVVGRLPILVARGVQHAIVLLDRETHQSCPGELAARIGQALATCPESARVSQVTVVVKDRMYENWLVADVENLRRLRGRFTVDPALESKVSPDKADRTDALAILRGAAKRNAYDKVPDAVQIMRTADPARVGENSRSFRRLLRVLDHPQYCHQSRRAAGSL